MDWIEQINQALHYIEMNLDGEIDMEEISRIALCPIGVFQRFFMLSTGITLGEYIRRRKLTCAAETLMRSDEKIIDLALRYGYESANAFYIAFKRLFGVPPSAVRQSVVPLRLHHRLFFNLKITKVKGGDDMVLTNVDVYRVKEPLFECIRVALSALGDVYSPEYIQGISGAAFKIANGCPSRPTCVYTRWTTDMLRALGYEIKEVPCYGENGEDLSAELIESIKREIDRGRPVLGWNAFTSFEWDVICGYDAQEEQFIGRGSYRGLNGYDREPWDRLMSRDEPAMAFGAVLIGERVTQSDLYALEIESLKDAVAHARQIDDKELPEGQNAYRKWVMQYSAPGKERDLADAYCHDIYSAVRATAAGYLRAILPHFPDAARPHIENAAQCFAAEALSLDKARPLIGWDSIWGVDEERSGQLAPILAEAAEHYANAVDHLDRALHAIDAL